MGWNGIHLKWVALWFAVLFGVVFGQEQSMSHDLVVDSFDQLAQDRVNQIACLPIGSSHCVGSVTKFERVPLRIWIGIK